MGALDPADDADDGEQSETWELLNDELRHRIDVQRSAFDKIEARAGIVAAVAFAALQFVAGERVDSDWLPPALGAYGAAMVCAGAIALLPRRFDEPKPMTMLVGLWMYPRGRASAELANNRRVAFEKNLPRQALRVWVLRVSVAFLVAGAILSTVHLTQGDLAPMSDETPEDAAPPVPQAPAPPPEEPPEPGIPTMNLLETDIRAIVGSGDPEHLFHAVEGGEHPAVERGEHKGAEG
jgi:hypothetical protein